MNLLASIVSTAANVEENLEELEAIVDGVSFFMKRGREERTTGKEISFDAR